MAQSKDIFVYMDWQESDLPILNRDELLILHNTICNYS